MDIAYLIGILARRKWLILTAMAIAAATTFLFIGSKPEKYKANAVIATGIVNYKGINSDNSDAFVQQYQVENAFLNLIEFTQSRAVLKLLSIEMLQHDLAAEGGNSAEKPFRQANRSLSNFSDEEKKQLFAELQKIQLDSLADPAFSQQFDFNLDKIARAYGYDNDALRRSLSVKRKTSTDYLDIQWVTESPELSKYMATVYANRLLNYYFNLSVKEKRKNVDSYQKLSTEKKNVVDSIYDMRFEYLRQKGLPVLGRQSEELVSQITKLELDRQRAQSKKTSSAESVDRIKKYERDHESRDAREVKNRMLERSNTVDQMEKVRELRRKSMEAGGKDPDIEAELNAANAELEESLRTSARSQGKARNEEGKKTKEDLYKERVSVDLDRIDAEESYSRLNNEIYSLKNKLGSMVVNDEVSTRMQEALDRATYEFEKVDDELIKAKLALENAENPLSIVQNAQLPEWPEPNRQVLLSIFAAIVIGSMSVIGLFVLAYMDGSLQSPDLFKKYTEGLPLLGTVPAVAVKGFDPEKIFSANGDMKAFTPFRESLRKIRGQVLHSGKKTFLVVSTKEKEGKTLVMLSLAHSLAFNNKRVLILDTNFKSPLPETFIDQPSANRALLNKTLRDHGLAEVFQLKSKTADNTAPQLVDVLGNTGLHQSPSELLDTETFQAFLADLQQHYDIVLLESAALNGYSDAQELEPFADKVIAVFNANSSLGNADNESLEYLRKLGNKFLGSVLTEVDAQKAA
jgi:polysaccharide biosynthesis transport protein